MVLVPKKAAKKLSLRRRAHKLTLVDLFQCRMIEKRMIDTGYLIILYSIVKNAQRLPLEPSVFQFFRVLFSLHFLEYISVIMLPSEILYSPLPVIQRTRITINSLNDEIIPLQFRFLNKDQLQRLLIGFQFPPKLTNAEGYNFSGEEVLLAGLFRLAVPNRLAGDEWRNLFGMDYQAVSKCFHVFLNFMIHNWAYLLFDNVDFWTPHIPFFVEKIGLKLESAYDCPFVPANVAGGFHTFGFIDNTNTAICRPGGGPVADGVNAPFSNDPLLQRSWVEWLGKVPWYRMANSPPFKWYGLSCI